MKIYILCLATFIFQITLISCRKDNDPNGGASLTIVNAIPGSSNFVTNFNASTTLQYFNTAQQIGYGSFSEFSSYAGNIQLSISQISDTMNTIYHNTTLNLALGSTHTLFICGTVAVPDTLYTTDNPPNFSITDSLTGVRFINIAKTNNPISINIENHSFGSEVSSLPYKGLTNFIPYPFSLSINNYIFEVRDAVNNSLLLTYSFDIIPFKNVTLALIGIEGGSGGSDLQMVEINNY